LLALRARGFAARADAELRWRFTDLVAPTSIEYMRSATASLAFLLVAFAAHAQMPAAQQLPTGAPPLAANPTATKFTFVVAGDNRPAKSTDPLTAPLLDIIGRLAAQPPAFVMWNGDAVFGKREAGIAAQYAAFLAALRKLPVPVFNAPGNHELVVQTNIPCGTKDDPWNAELPDWSGSMLARYGGSMGPAYGMFRYGNAALLVLNTDDVPDVAIPSACDYAGFVGGAQLNALQTSLDQLSKDDGVAHIFLFMHRPIHDDNGSQIVAPTPGTDYANRLAQFRSLIDTNAHPKVTFVFASHDHRLWVYPAPSNPNGPFTRSAPATENPTFIVTGGAGAPLEGCKHPAANGGPAGAYFHYMVVSVDGANVTVSVNPLYGTTPCATGAAPVARRDARPARRSRTAAARRRRRG
jgi:hypothetical protein